MDAIALMGEVSEVRPLSNLTMYLFCYYQIFLVISC